MGVLRKLTHFIMILFLRTTSNHTLQMRTQKEIFKLAARLFCETDRIYSQNCASPNWRKEKKKKKIFPGLRPEAPLFHYRHSKNFHNLPKLNPILRAHSNTHFIIKNYFPYQHTTSNVKSPVLCQTTDDALNKSVKK